MKQFACGDVVPRCQRVFTAPTDADILGQVADHARADHGLVEVPDALVAQVVERIRVLA